MTEMTGGCQCGRVRFVAEVGSDDAYFCHCKMCRRATGSVAISFMGIAKDKVTWEREPDWYQSSPIAHRPFCSTCGTPLGFAFLDGANMDLTVGAFDDPSRFVPRHNYAVESRLEHWRNTDGLPEMRTEENPNVVDRWMAATGKLPD